MSPAAIPNRARLWMKQNQISEDELLQVFHLSDGSAEVIASDIPGKSDKEKAMNAYVLIGVGKLLATGEPSFDDEAGRAFCRSLACFDTTNHSKYQKGNELAGSKEKGWTLTAPGLKRGAAIVKELNGPTK